MHIRRLYVYHVFLIALNVCMPCKCMYLHGQKTHVWNNDVLTKRFISSNKCGHMTDSMEFGPTCSVESLEKLRFC